MLNTLRWTGMLYLKAMGLSLGVTITLLLALGTAGCASTDKSASSTPQRQTTDTSTAPATQRGFAKETPHERMEMYIGPNIPQEHLEREHH